MNSKISLAQNNYNQVNLAHFRLLEAAESAKYAATLIDDVIVIATLTAQEASRQANEVTRLATQAAAKVVEVARVTALSADKISADALQAAKVSSAAAARHATEVKKLAAVVAAEVVEVARVTAAASEKLAAESEALVARVAIATKSAAASSAGAVAASALLLATAKAILDDYKHEAVNPGTAGTVG